MEVLKLDFPAPTFDGLRVLIIDENAIRKGHGYVILVLNGVTGELLHIAEGKKKESLGPFFEVLTKDMAAANGANTNTKNVERVTKTSG